MAKKIMVLIVAAGESRRTGGNIPKQYQMLEGKSLLQRCVETFLSHPDIAGVGMVINPLHKILYHEHTKELAVLPPVEGGASRQASVALGLKSLEKENPDYILIHDAARPNVSFELISRVIEGLETANAVIPALPVVDTLKQVEGGVITSTIDRSTLFRAQTPQGFHYLDIVKAHENAKDYPCTDDAMVAEYAGMQVKTVPGSEHNGKITTMEDMQDARLLLESAYETRTGTGFDVHKIIRTKNTLVICGITITCGFGLEGHSDADVGLHALVDALLGAMAEGDIGTHFPPSDLQWQGADSSLFVKHAVKLLKNKHGKIINADITIICEKPAIAPHRAAMIANVAELLEVDSSRISVKATTTEKLGFTGRGEGIAAQAVVTIKMKGQ